MTAVPYVAVVGSGDATSDDIDHADAVGQALAHAGAVLVCGGLGGVMRAACRGAHESGGITIGLLPGTDRGAANPYLTVAITTGLGELRNGLVVRASDAVIAIGGEYGTLSEVALALKLGLPVVGLGTWELAHGGRADDGILRVDDPGDAVATAVGAASR